MGEIYNNKSKNTDSKMNPEKILAWESDLKSKKFTGKFLETIEQVRYIGGIDISYPVKNPETNPAIVVYSIFDLTNSRIVCSKHKLIEADRQLPYIAGFLGAKEADMMSDLINETINSLSDEIIPDRRDIHPFVPDVILIDGNGLLHSRKFGSACYIHKICNIPTIGVAKNLLHVPGITPKPRDEDFKTKCQTKLINFGDKIVYHDDNTNTDIVAVVKSSKNIGPCTKPIYISLGGGVKDLNLATEIVLKTCISKIPQPIRIADLQGRDWLKNGKLGDFEN